MSLGRIDLVILDLDGTLYSSTATTLGAVERAVKALNERHGLAVEQPSNEEILSGVGMTRREFAEAVFPELPERYYDDMDDLIWHWERELVTGGRGSLFPGALDALEDLKASGHTLAVATNAGTGYMDHILDYFDIRRLFAEARCAGTEGTTDKRDLLELITRSLNRDPAESVMVGDRRSDIDAADRAGAHSIGCTWGFGSRDELAGADLVIDDFGELEGAVEALGAPPGDVRPARPGDRA
ncbi:MAG: HAD hydrolase-like protein [Candidatus Eisenbacteria bacterium]|nr:HAD hydrolase-like protein [Candidatus Eisenbacteria bacterium]